MMVIKIKKIFYILFLVLLIPFACGGINDLYEKVSGTDDNTSGTDENVPPGVTVSPAEGAWLSGEPGAINSEIKIIFDSSMVPASLKLAGTMASTSAFSWSATAIENDTLTITPSLSRTNGSGETITIDCDTIDYNYINMTLTYNIAKSVYYVKSAAAGALIGTRTDPMDSIQNAVNAAAAGTPGVVLVAQGTFVYSGGATDQYGYIIDAIEDVSLYGSFSDEDWDKRDVTVYPTILQDTRTTSNGSQSTTAPYRVINIAAGISSATILDGFEIWIAPITGGPSTPSACAFFISDASPVIRNNIIRSYDIVNGSSVNIMGIRLITGGNPQISDNIINLGSMTGASNSCINYGLYISYGNPVIRKNSITAGQSTGTSGITYGIHLESSGGEISANKLISGGMGNTISRGINLVSSSPVIEGNTLITASAVSQAWGIYLQISSHATIRKNILSNFSASSVFGIQVASQSIPDICSNYIDMGNNPTTCGIRINNEDTGAAEFTDIYNNVINAGSGTSTTGLEVYSVDTRVRILNNTIDGGGSGNFATAVNLRRASAPGANTRIWIFNNNIFTVNTSASNYGIREFDVNSYPDILAYNNIFHCDILYEDNGGAGPISDIVNLNGLDLGGSEPAKENITEDIYPQLDKSNYYRFTGNSGSVMFDTEGLQTGEVILDRDDKPRTDPYSIGAYEYD